MPDLNTTNLDQVEKIVADIARSMGLTVRFRTASVLRVGNCVAYARIHGDLVRGPGFLGKAFHRNVSRLCSNPRYSHGHGIEHGFGRRPPR